MPAPELVANDLLDAEIKELEDLKTIRRLAAIPRNFEFMRRIVEGALNGKNGSSAEAPIDKGVRRGPVGTTAPNGLTPAVFQCAAKMRTNITVTGLTQAVKDAGYTFVTTNPRLSVSEVIRNNSDKFVVVQRGSGPNPIIYKWTGD